MKNFLDKKWTHTHTTVFRLIFDRIIRNILCSNKFVNHSIHPPPHPSPSFHTHPFSFISIIYLVTLVRSVFGKWTFTFVTSTLKYKRLTSEWRNEICSEHLCLDDRESNWILKKKEFIHSIQVIYSPQENDDQVLSVWFSSRWANVKSTIYSRTKLEYKT